MRKKVVTSDSRSQTRQIDAHVSQCLERQLAQANEELTQFNYHVSHDLVAPISSARGLLNLIQEDLEAGVVDELPDLLADAQSQLVRLDNLVSDLMSLARAGAGDMSIEYFDLRLLLDDIVASLSMHALELEISVTLKTDQSQFLGDRVRIQQILANLISNARKFADPDEICPEITLNCSRMDNGACLTVSDNGIGIDPALEEGLFGLFTCGVNQHAGHGLGLYIVDKHVAKLGGTVSVASYRKPTVFEVFLPNPTGSLQSSSTDSVPSISTKSDPV